MARTLIKGFAGLPSFILMAVTGRSQAFHDLVTGSTVQIKDLERAKESHYTLDRPAYEVSDISRPRRIGVTLGYLAALGGLDMIADAVFPGDLLLNGAVGALLAVLGGLAIYLGWEGRLPGAKSAARTLSIPVVTLALALGFGADAAAQAPRYLDPGTGPWDLVDEEEVQDVCRLDYDLLNDARIPANASFAVVRYGRLCYVSGPSAAAASTVTHNWSATKTLGALLTGMVMYETRNLPESDLPGSGPLTEFDRMDRWIDLTALPDSADIHPDATVSHVLAMVGYSDDLAHGRKRHLYDARGDREINYLIDVIDKVAEQDPRAFGADAVAAKNDLFRKLGFEHSTWAVDRFGYGWYGSLTDMARLGLALLHGGVYGGERIAEAQYVYNMTHPAFEDGSTRYGYLTWMNDTRCAPRAIHATYPHGLSGATDCADGNCDQPYDVGMWYAYGANGQYILGHRGLDMVVVGKNWRNGGEDDLWETVLPSVVAADPRFRGDRQGFCEAYASNSYAPDLVPWEEGL